MNGTNRLGGCVAVTIAMILTSAGALAEQTEPSRDFVLPHDPVAFPPGPGSDIASGLCVICHSAEYVYMQPPHDRQQWKKIVLKMRSAFGCPITENQIEPLTSYLVSQNATPRGHRVARLQPAKGSVVGGANLAKGRSVYETYCLNCHGSNGQGDGPVGKTLLPPAANLTSGRVRLKSDSEMLKVIRNGRSGTAMPSWEGDLSEAEIRAVLAYIRSLSE